MTGTASHLRTGFLAFVEHCGVVAGRSAGLDDGLSLFELGDRLGYGVGYVRHRHLEPYLSAPLPFLAAAAQRTTSLRLGTAVVPVRYEHPVRLAEEAATVDLLSGGRLELGLSAGYARGEASFGPAYGFAEGSYDEEVERRLSRFLVAVQGEAVTVADVDTGFAEAGTPLAVQPYSPTLRDRVAYGAGRAASAQRSGRLGLGLQLSTLNTEFSAPTFEQAQAEAIEAYRVAHRATGRGDGFVSVSRMVLPVLTDQDAEAYAWLIARDAQRQRDLGLPTVPPLFYGRVHHGAPDAVAAALAADVAIRAADELVLALPFDHPPAVVRRLLTTVAEQVLPQVVEGVARPLPTVG